VGSERGAFTPLMGAGSLILGVIVLGGVSVGRLAAVKQDSQHAADAAAMSAVQLVRDRGMPFDAAAQAAAEATGSANAKLPVSYTWTVTERPDSVDIEVTTAIAVAGGVAMIGGDRTVRSAATAAIRQSRFDEADRRLPKLVLILDYSGSMNAPFFGGGDTKINVLENSVAGLLAADLMIDYGAAFYSGGVFATVGIGPGAPAQINNVMAANGAGGVTNTAAALGAGRNLLTAAENTGRYALLVSDGAPCCSADSVTQAKNTAPSLWDNDITIFTLEIRDNPPVASLAQFMTDVAGSPSSRGDAAFHFVAESAADLVDKFKKIVAEIVCAIGPITPAPTDAATLRVFLKSGTTERRVSLLNDLPTYAPGDDLADHTDEEAFIFNFAEQKVHLSERACNAIIDSGDDAIVRFDSPYLID
jgi:Flp pilus assembly protein TadG